MKNISNEKKKDVNCRCMKLSTTYITDNIFYSQNVAPAIFGDDGKSCAGEYRFGFNGQETDSETGYQIFKYRMYDSRIARFFAVDPLIWKFPYYSPYQFASNSPIVAVDMEGLQSSYRINYNEITLEIQNGQLRNSQELNRLNQGTEYGFGSNLGSGNSPLPGGYVNVFCSNCTHRDGSIGANVWLKVPKFEVVRSIDVEKTREITIEGTAPIPERRHSSTSTESNSAHWSTHNNSSEVNVSSVNIKNAQEAVLTNAAKGLRTVGENQKKELLKMTLVFKEDTEFNEYIKKAVESKYGIPVNMNVNPTKVKDKGNNNYVTLYSTIKTTTITPATPGTPNTYITEKYIEKETVKVSPVEIIE